MTATQVEGTVLIYEKMFESRMFFVDKLIGMGARIILCDPHRAVVSGRCRLKGAELVSPDVRAGMAMVLAAPKFREKFSQVEYLIIDEIHEICGPKRGAHLSLTLERLQELSTKPITRIGLSATLAPIESIASYLVGYDRGEMRDVKVLEVKTKRNLDLRVICPTEDITTLPYEIVNSKMRTRAGTEANESVPEIGRAGRHLEDCRKFPPAGSMSVGKRRVKNIVAVLPYRSPVRIQSEPDP